MKTGKQQPIENPFWTHSVTCYGREGVRALCLEFQETSDADVNLLLFGLWLGCEGYVVSEAGAQVFAQAVAPWHCEVVRPLRAVRRRLKGWAIVDDKPRERLRSAIQTWEIEAERLQQDMLYGLFMERLNELCAPAPCGRKAMQANLHTFLALSPGYAGSPKAVEKLVSLCL